MDTTHSTNTDKDIDFDSGDDIRMTTPTASKIFLNDITLQTATGSSTNTISSTTYKNVFTSATGVVEVGVAPTTPLGIVNKAYADALPNTKFTVSNSFAVGNLLYLNSTTYTKAIATSAAASEVVGMVVATDGSTYFTVAPSGYVTGLSGLTAGTVYYLSPSSAGAMTATQPSTPTQVIKQVFVADTTTSGWLTIRDGSQL